MSGIEDKIKDSIRIERVTSSYSIEGRSPKGIKTSSFLSYTAKCDHDRGWSMDEARYVEATLAMRVAEDLYTDAFIRQQITRENRDTQVEHLTPMYETLQKSRLEKLQGKKHVLDSDAIRNPAAQS